VPAFAAREKATSVDFEPAALGPGTWGNCRAATKRCAGHTTNWGALHQYDLSSGAGQR